MSDLNAKALEAAHAAYWHARSEYSPDALPQAIRTYLRESGPDDATERARLSAGVARLREALNEGRRAIGDHFAPNDCYATGPLTGDPHRDLVECPACSFIKMYEAVVPEALRHDPR